MEGDREQKLDNFKDINDNQEKLFFLLSSIGDKRKTNSQKKKRYKYLIKIKNSSENLSKFYFIFYSIIIIIIIWILIFSIIRIKAFNLFIGICISLLYIYFNKNIEDDNTKSKLSNSY